MRLAVTAQSLDSDFQGRVHAELRRALPAGWTLVDVAIERWGDPERVRARLGELLGDAPPAALVGICVWLDSATMARFRDAGVPVVLVDERTDGASTVACDNVAGGVVAAQHLLRSGRRAIAVVSGPVRDYNAMQRLRGVSRALSEAGVPLPQELLLQAEHYSHEDGERALARLLDGPARFDAVVCTAGDACAAGLLAAARARGLRVPDDVAIVGYDDAPLAATTDPPLTTVSQSVEVIAREVVRLATQEAAAIREKPRVVLLEPRLVLRGSVGAPARAAP
jgi:DNA-binding LacI/PurR family transcriptional regulator